MPWKRGRGTNSWAIRSRIASRWARRRGARCSRCRRCLSTMSRSMTQWERWRDSRSPSRGRSESGRTQEIGTFVPLHRKASGVGKAPVAHDQWPCALRAQSTPYRDGTTHVIFEPMDFTAPAHPCARGISASLHVIARLVALVPKPRVNLTRLDEEQKWTPDLGHTVQ